MRSMRMRGEGQNVRINIEFACSSDVITVWNADIKHGNYRKATKVISIQIKRAKMPRYVGGTEFSSD